MTSASALEQHVQMPLETATIRLFCRPLPLGDSGTSGKSWRILSPLPKSKRTVNPIRSIVDPIFANIQSAEERSDGKNHISLAIRFVSYRRKVHSVTRVDVAHTMDWFLH